MVNCAENQLLHFFLPEVRYLFRHGCTESDQTPSAETQPKPMCLRCNLYDDQQTYNAFPLGSACTPFGVRSIIFFCHLFGILSILN